MSSVLVIEENKLIRWALHEYFQNEGFNSREVDSYRSAVKIAEESEFRLVIASCELSDPMTIESVRHIHSLQQDSMLVILTTDREDQIRAALSDLQLFDIIEKPFSVDKFLGIVQMARTIK